MREGFLPIRRASTWSESSPMLPVDEGKTITKKWKFKEPWQNGEIEKGMGERESEQGIDFEVEMIIQIFPDPNPLLLWTNTLKKETATSPSWYSVWDTSWTLLIWWATFLRDDKIRFLKAYNPWWIVFILPETGYIEHCHVQWFSN
jgi:hypothetical protein